VVLEVRLTVFGEVRNQWIISRERDQVLDLGRIKTFHMREPALFPQKLVNDAVVVGNGHCVSWLGSGVHDRQVLGPRVRWLWGGGGW
jgi:hypothetical protein